MKALEPRKCLLRNDPRHTCDPKELRGQHGKTVIGVWPCFQSALKQYREGVAEHPEPEEEGR